MRAFEDRFLTIGLPYRVIGGPRFYERQEIRDAMAYFRVAVSPDDGLAFERIVNVPKRGIGDKALQEINRTARDNGVSLLDAAGLLGGQRRPPGHAPAPPSASSSTGFDRWHAAVRDGARPRRARRDHPRGVGLHRHVARREVRRGRPAASTTSRSWSRALDEFENLQGFLEHVALIMDNDQEEGAAKVSVMTLHAAKGLEFPAVFLPGWEDGLFPSQRSMDESGLKGLEEERRLAYVGITRARRLCTISFAANRRVYNQWQSQLPSRFIDELPPAHIEVLTPPGLYGGGYGAAAPAAPRRSDARRDRRQGRRLQLPGLEADAGPRRRPRHVAAAGGAQHGDRRHRRRRPTTPARASSTRSSATAPSPPSRATSSPSTSRRPAPRTSSPASSPPPTPCRSERPVGAAVAT